MSQPAKKRVLLIEDEAIVAMLVEDMLDELGFEVAASASRLSEAVRLAQSETVDLAVLDVNLNGERSYPVADALRARSIPFVFVTGYGADGLEERFALTPTMQKPFQLIDLKDVLTKAGAMPA
jgi:CheY-like chemotaxis protein